MVHYFREENYFLGNDIMDVEAVDMKGLNRIISSELSERSTVVWKTWKDFSVRVMQILPPESE